MHNKAHLGLEGYDTSASIELTGSVVGFELMDPHSLLFVDVANSDGTVTSWSVEGGSASGIVGSGISTEFLGSEPTVTILVFPSRDKTCAPLCKASGREFNFQDR